MQVAVFDFDGTLTRSDTLGPFLREVAGTVALARAFAADAARIALAAAGRASRDDAKERMLQRLLGGRAHEDLARLGHDFGARVAKDRLRSEMLARLRWHERSGHEIA